MDNIINTAMEFVVGLALLPIAGGFAVYVSSDPNLSSIMGLTLVISLGVIILGLGIVAMTARKLFKK